MSKLVSKFTDEYVDLLPKTGKRYEVKEKSGLRIEVLVSGKKVWRKWFRMDGKQTT